MQHEIIRSTMQALVIKLAPGEQVYTESGAMACMSDSIQMESGFGADSWAQSAAGSLARAGLFGVEAAVELRLCADVAGAGQSQGSVDAEVACIVGRKYSGEGGP
jgi:uncharacterized protein (AIM24 family)